VQGHTDNVPLSSPRAGVQTGAGRALASVVRLFEKRGLDQRTCARSLQGAPRSTEQGPRAQSAHRHRLKPIDASEEPRPRPTARAQCGGGRADAVIAQGAARLEAVYRAALGDRSGASARCAQRAGARDRGPRRADGRACRTHPIERAGRSPRPPRPWARGCGRARARAGGPSAHSLLSCASRPPDPRQARRRARSCSQGDGR
jgi:hypothetical protein